MKNPSLKSIARVFVLFLLLSTAWLTYSTIIFVKAIGTLWWPVTKGTVISAGIKEYHSSKGANKSGPDIRYSYTVGNEKYQSDRYSPTVARGSSMWAKQVADQYPANTKITVYYNPRKPHLAIIKPGLQSDNYWMIFLSAGTTVLILMAFIRQIKLRRNNEITSG